MSFKRIRPLFPTLILAISPLLAIGQQVGGAALSSQVPTDPNQPVPTIQVTSRLVVLDVVVSDGSGTPVKGLKPSDFILLEDGVPQTITGFSEHDAGDMTPPAPHENLPPNTFAVQPPFQHGTAMTAIVISAQGAQFLYVLDQLRSYLKSSAPQTPIAIFRMDWQGMHLVQGFTADHKALLDAAYSKRIEPPLGFQTGPYVSVPGSPTHALARYLSGFPGRINVLWFSAGNVDSDMSREFPDLASFVQDLGAITDATRLSPVALYFADATAVAAPAIRWFSFDQSVDEIAYQLGYPSVLGAFMEDNRNVPGAGLLESLKLEADRTLFDNSSPLSPASGPSFEGCRHSDVAQSTGGAAFCNTNGFKDVIARVVSTGSHYYTLSYRSTNTNWNGAYRKIQLAVKGLDKIQPPEPTAWQQITGYGTVQQPKLEYRAGYFARPTRPTVETTTVSAIRSSAARASAPDTAAQSQRKLLSVSPKGDPAATQTDSMERAMALASPTPDAVHFTVVVSAPKLKEKIGRNDVLPRDNFLTAPFRNMPFRNFDVHYWVNPADLHFTATASGRYRCDLQFVTIIYRDDGMVANTLSTRSHIEVTAEQLEDVQAAGVTLDQTIAIPVDGHFFLRSGVQERQTGNTGAIEVPVEWIKLSPEKALADNRAHTNR